MKWYSIVHEDWTMVERVFKSHVAPEPLAGHVASALKERGMESMKMEEVKDTNFTVDLPGMISMNRYLHKFNIDEATIHIPATDLEIIHDDIESFYELRDDIGLDYYKIHTRFWCLCLTPDQRNELLRQVKLELPKAKLIANEENRSFNEALCGEQAIKKGVYVKPRKVEDIKPKGSA